MNTKNNQRTRISKMLLKNALLDLLNETGNVSKISVRELCERAELNRSTFYAHYSEPKDLLAELEDEILSATNNYIMNIGKENHIGAHRFLCAFLEYIQQNDKQLRTLLIDLQDSGFRNRFMQQSILQFINNLNIELDKEYEQFIFSYILNGSTSIIVQWIRSDYRMSSEKLCAFLFDINESALINLKQYIKEKRHG